MIPPSTNFYDPLLQELYEASQQLRPFLEASTDRFSENEAKTLDWLKKENAMTYAQKLRQQADELEAKDAAIIRFRKALEAIDQRGA